MDELLEQLVNDCMGYTKEGRVATYIPELSKVSPDALGVYMIASDGKHYGAGDHAAHFTIQSIVKPILLLQALLDNGISVFILPRWIPRVTVLRGSSCWKN